MNKKGRYFDSIQMSMMFVVIVSLVIWQFISPLLGFGNYKVIEVKQDIGAVESVTNLQNNFTKCLEEKNIIEINYNNSKNKEYILSLQEQIKKDKDEAWILPTMAMILYLIVFFILEYSNRKTIKKLNKEIEELTNKKGAKKK
jgi:phosphotransferase system  glucose/maltose/N-acetylglucosamine-specific IIC component